MHERIKKLNIEIKTFFHERKRAMVKRNICPGSTASLWKAVKKARDVNTNEIPNQKKKNFIKTDTLPLLNQAQSCWSTS